MTTPLVSVCIPLRDHGRYVGGAVASALAQDVDGLEVLVHDDASRDAPAVPADPRVRYLRHGRPLGVAGNRNSLLARARGRFVAWLDADDELLPGALAPRLELLEARPEIAIAHGAFAVVDAAGAPLPSWPAPFAVDTIEPADEALPHLVCANELTTSTVLVRRELHSGFDPRIGRSSSDWHAWLRVARRGGVAYTAAPVGRYRQHAATISHRTAASGERLRCDIRVVRGVLREAPHLRGPAMAALAAKALIRAGDEYTAGRRAGAARTAMLAARLDPRLLRDSAPLLDAAARGDDGAWFERSRRALARLAERFDGTRAGRRLRERLAVDPYWYARLEAIAATVERVVPAGAEVAAVTKWDPTLLALAGRRGRNFPDRRLLPEGYPPDGATAVAHLEALRADGVTHLVLPCASFWWLEHYGELRAHLARTARTAWSDADVVVFDL
jgi:hypothetical protein